MNRFDKQIAGETGSISIATASGAISGDFCEILCIGSVTFTTLTDALEKTSAQYGRKATGTITFTGAPIVDDVVSVAGQDFTFKVAAATEDEITIGANVTATAANVAAAINVLLSSVVTATSALGVVTITAVSGGTGGNALTLTEAATNTAVSGAGTLTGGTNLVAASSLTYADGHILRGKFTTVHLAGGNARLTLSSGLSS